MIENIFLLDPCRARLEAVYGLPVGPALEAGGFQGRRLGDALPAERVAAGQGDGVAQHSGTHRAAQWVRASLTG